MTQAKGKGGHDDRVERAFLIEDIDRDSGNGDVLGRAGVRGSDDDGDSGGNGEAETAKGGTTGSGSSGGARMLLEWPPDLVSVSNSLNFAFFVSNVFHE